jgi:hypothetical protein
VSPRLFVVLNACACAHEYLNHLMVPRPTYQQQWYIALWILLIQVVSSICSSSLCSKLMSPGDMSLETHRSFSVTVPLLVSSRSSWFTHSRKNYPGFNEDQHDTTTTGSLGRSLLLKWRFGCSGAFKRTLRTTCCNTSKMKIQVFSDLFRSNRKWKSEGFQYHTICVHCTICHSFLPWQCRSHWQWDWGSGVCVSWLVVCVWPDEYTLSLCVVVSRLVTTFPRTSSFHLSSILNRVFPSLLFPWHSQVYLEKRYYHQVFW